jgi:hypothetical protein
VGPGGDGRWGRRRVVRKQCGNGMGMVMFGSGIVDFGRIMDCISIASDVYKV